MIRTSYRSSLIWAFTSLAKMLLIFKQAIKQTVFFVIGDLMVLTNSFAILFCGFSMGSNQYRSGRVYDLCFYFMTGTPE